MKKLLFLFIAVFTIFFATACNEEKKTLSTPSNVAITEKGLITWDKVENATSYVVTINEQTYLVKTNSFQVSDITNDFTYYVIAQADGYTSSTASQTQSFVGTSTSDKEALLNAVVESSGIDPNNLEAMAILKEGSNVAYEKGLTAETFAFIIESSVDSENVLLSLMMTAANLDKGEVSGFVYLAAYMLHVNLLSEKDNLDEVDYNTYISMLTDNNYEVAGALANVVNTVVNAYKQAAIKVLPSLEDVMGGQVVDTEKLVAILDDVAVILENNKPADEDLTIVFNTLLKTKDLVNKYANQLNENLLMIINAIYEVPVSEFVQDANALYSLVVSVLREITKEDLDILFSKDSILKGFVALVITKIDLSGLELPQLSGEQLDELVKGILESEGLALEDLLSLLGFTVEEYNEIIKTVASLLNNLGKTAKTLLSEETFKEILIALLDVSIETTQESLGNKTSKIGEEDELIQAVLDTYGFTSSSELELFEMYIVNNVVKDDGLVVINTYTVWVMDVTDTVVEYDLSASSSIISGAGALVDLVGALVDEFKVNQNAVLTDVVALLKVLSNKEFTTENGTVVFPDFTNLKEEDVKQLASDLVALLEVLVPYVKEAGAEELIAAISTSDFGSLVAYLTPFMTSENIALVENLVTSAAKVFDSMNLLPGMGFTTQEEFIESIMGIVNSMFVPEQ